MSDDDFALSIAINGQFQEQVKMLMVIYFASHESAEPKPAEAFRARLKLARERRDDALKALTE